MTPVKDKIELDMWLFLHNHVGRIQSLWVVYYLLKIQLSTNFRVVEENLVDEYGGIVLDTRNSFGGRLGGTDNII